MKDSLGWPAPSNSQSSQARLRLAFWCGGAIFAAFLLVGYHHNQVYPLLDELAVTPEASSSTEAGGLSLADLDTCASVVESQKQQLSDVFGDILEGVHNIMLLGIPAHQNKGDSAIYHAQSTLFAALGIRVQHECAAGDCWTSVLDKVVEQWKDDHFAIVFMGGGNLGDIYMAEQLLKINVMERYKDIRTHIFPQSLSFRFDETRIRQEEAFAAMTHPLNSLALRDTVSYDFARKHFNTTNLRLDLTPDIVFYLGFRPDLRNRLNPESPADLLFFRRSDGEGSEWFFAGNADSLTFPGPFVKQLEDATRKGTLHAIKGDWVDFDLTPAEMSSGHQPSRAWRRLMMGAEWLSRADFIVLDRLHGHIVSTILGIPHVIVDNNIGKLSAYHSTWTSPCRLGQIVPHGDNQTAGVIEKYKSWVETGKLSGRDYLASRIVVQP